LPDEVEFESPDQLDLPGLLDPDEDPGVLEGRRRSRRQRQRRKQRSRQRSRQRNRRLGIRSGVDEEEATFPDEDAAKEEYAGDSYCMDECGGVMKDLPWLDGFKCV
jgi:hypothetical protein